MSISAIKSKLYSEASAAGEQLALPDHRYVSVVSVNHPEPSGAVHGPALQEIPLYRQLAYLLVQLGYQRILMVVLPCLPGTEQFRCTLGELLLPVVNQRRVDLEPASQL